MKKKWLDQQIAELQKQSQELDKIEAEIAEKKQQEAEEENKILIAEEENSYKVFGRDFSVSDESIVEYYKYRMKIMAIEYKLSGYVNSEGQYVIPKEIKYDLIAMKKEIEEMGDDYYKASALYMKKYFNFTISLTMLDDGRAKASLELAEYVGKNVDGEMIYTHIADFVDVYDDEYRVKLRKAFNLYDVEVKNDDFTIPTLAVLMQDLFDIDMFIGGLYDTASQIYVIRMLKLLESGGEKEKEIIERYSELVAEIEEEHEKDFEVIEVAGRKVYKQKDKYINEKKKECLDKAIDENGGLQKLDVDKKFLDSVVDEANKTNEAIGKLKPGGILEVEAPNSDSKSSSGSSGGSKKPSKSKKAGSNKGSDKKPSKKKKEEKKKDEKKSSSGGGASNNNSERDDIYRDLAESTQRANEAAQEAYETAVGSTEEVNEVLDEYLDNEATAERPNNDAEGEIFVEIYEDGDEDSDEAGDEEDVYRTEDDGAEGNPTGPEDATEGINEDLVGDAETAASSSEGDAGGTTTEEVVDEADLLLDLENKTESHARGGMLDLAGADDFEAEI